MAHVQLPFGKLKSGNNMTVKRLYTRQGLVLTLNTKIFLPLLSEGIHQPVKNVTRSHLADKILLINRNVLFLFTETFCIAEIDFKTAVHMVCLQQLKVMKP